MPSYKRQRAGVARKHLLPLWGCTGFMAETSPTRLLIWDEIAHALQSGESGGTILGPGALQRNTLVARRSPDLFSADQGTIKPALSLRRDHVDDLARILLQVPYGIKSPDFRTFTDYGIRVEEGRSPESKYSIDNCFVAIGVKTFFGMSHHRASQGNQIYLFVGEEIPIPAGVSCTEHKFIPIGLASYTLRKAWFQDYDTFTQNMVEKALLLWEADSANESRTREVEQCVLSSRFFSEVKLAVRRRKYEAVEDVPNLGALYDLK